MSFCEVISHGLSESINILSESSTRLDMVSQKELDYAYIAGCMDADGYFQLNNREKENKTYFIRIGINQVKIDSIKLINNYFNCSIRQNNPKGNRNIQYCLHIKSNNKIKFLKKVIPYLVIKKHQAEICLQMEEHIDWLKKSIPYNRNSHGAIIGGRQIPLKEKIYRDQLYNNFIDSYKSYTTNSIIDFYKNNDLQLAYSYIAGLMDGDGYFGISKKYLPRIMIEQITIGSLQLINYFFPTKITIRKENVQKKAQKTYSISIGSEKISSFLNCIIPYLRIKKQQAENLLVLQKNINKYNNSSFRYTGLPSSIKDYRMRLYLENKQLNQVGKQLDNFNNSQEIIKNIQSYSKNKKLLDFI
jgi:hypothetical protein